MTFDVHAADPAVYAVERDVVLLSVEHPPAGVGHAQASVAGDRAGVGLGVEERDRRRDEPGHLVEAPRIAEERARLSGTGAHEGGAGGLCTLGDRGEDAPFGQRQPIARGRVLAAETVEGLSQESQLRGGRAHDRAQPQGVRERAAPSRRGRRAPSRSRSSSSRRLPAGD